MKRKLKIGVWLYAGISQKDGGGFGYISELIDKLNTTRFTDAEIIFVGNNAHSDIMQVGYHNVDSWLFRGKNTISRIRNFFRATAILAPLNFLVDSLDRKRDAILMSRLAKAVDVMYYTAPVCIFPRFPYVFTIWDLGHLTTFAFPEVSMNGVFEHRNSEYFHLPFKSLLVFVESEAGKAQAISYLGLQPERVQVIPIFPSGIIHENVVAVKPAQIGGDTFFIHYPAQFWAHKNHFNLIIALQQVVKQYPQLQLVLTGSDKGNKQYIQGLIVDMGLQGNVIDLGFVSSGEMKWLYLNSQGLVMPTFLGPTNMPLLEAAKLNCLVACSNFAGHVEELGDYGIYFEPAEPADIADKICLMLSQKSRGILPAYVSKFDITNTLAALDTSFSRLFHIRATWGGNGHIG